MIRSRTFPLLKAKIYAYLAFAKELLHQHAPNGLADKFFAILKKQRKVFGVEFLAKNLPEGY